MNPPLGFNRGGMIVPLQLKGSGSIHHVVTKPLFRISSPSNLHHTWEGWVGNHIDAPILYVESWRSRILNCIFQNPIPPLFKHGVHHLNWRRPPPIYPFFFFVSFSSHRVAGSTNKIVPTHTARSPIPVVAAFWNKFCPTPTTVSGFLASYDRAWYRRRV